MYRARDTKLDRDVALKVLPQAFTDDPDRLARFEREAKVLASLNHPNIGGIHGLEESEGIKALVLEYIEGPTLADRIKQGPIPVDEALPIAKQIAEALEAAHEQGVIHRDLKPANIKVREDGTVKVLDFGLAKALDTTPQGDPSQSPTLTAAATQMGVILGTAAYMSPEQARGKPVDKRADIWSFGVVLYEMLTGARPFQGEDVSLTLASVMKSDVNVTVLPAGLPETLRTVLRRCLEKDPLQRIRDMGDVRLAMDGAFETTLENVNSGAGRETGNFGLAANGSLVYLSGDSLAAQRTLVWVDREGREEVIGVEPGDHRGLRLAPDGERAALVVMDGDGNEDVLIYDLARDIATRFTFDPANDSYPVWSPDGERVVFASTREGVSSLFSKAADGTGEAERLTTSTRNQFSSSWSSDGTTLFFVETGPQTGLDIGILSMDDERASETLIETKFQEVYSEISPDGRWLAYQSAESGQREVYVRPFPNVDTGRWQVSRGGGLQPVWAPDGRELFYRRFDDQAMMVAPIETEPTFSPGNPAVLFEATNFPVPGGPRRFDIAPDGQRFLMTKQGETISEDATPPQINIVLNWHEELKRLVPVP